METQPGRRKDTSRNPRALNGSSPIPPSRFSGRIGEDHSQPYTAMSPRGTVSTSANKSQCRPPRQRLRKPRFIILGVDGGGVYNEIVAFHQFRQSQNGFPKPAAPCHGPTRSRRVSAPERDTGSPRAVAAAPILPQTHTALTRKSDIPNPPVATHKDHLQNTLALAFRTDFLG